MEIGEPNVLVGLPRTIGQHGRSLFAQVYGVRNGLKRKRQEICAAADGNSANIYETQNGRLVASYSVSPDSTFVCSPNSIRTRTGHGKAIRKTYCITKRRHDVRLQCFSETTMDDKLDLRTTSVELDSVYAATSQVEYVCQAEGDMVVVLAEAGHFAAYTSDLSSRLSTGQVALPEKEGKMVAYYATTLAEASKSMLKARSDIVSTASSTALVIAGTCRTINISDSQHDKLTHCIWMVSPTDRSLAQNNHPVLATSYVLPITSLSGSREQESVTYSARGTRLSLSSHSRVVSFDLSRVIPFKILDMASPVTECISNIAVTDHLRLFSTSGNLYLYNAQFRSLQASRDLDYASLKQHRGGKPITHLVFIAYLPQVSRVIATRHGHLVAIDLQTTRGTEFAQGIKHSSSLISNIGKGVLPHERTARHNKTIKRTAASTISRPENFGENWSSTVKRLGEAILQRDAKSFEDIFIEHVCKNSGKNEWTDDLSIPDGEINYIISKVFETPHFDDASDHLPRLSIALAAHRLIRSLSAQGYLTESRISTALFANSQNDTNQNLTQSRIVPSLAEHDPSLSLLSDFVQRSPFIDLPNLGAAVAITIRAARTKFGASETLAIKVDDTRDPGSENQKSIVTSLPHGTEIISDSPRDTITQTLFKALERLSGTDSALIGATLRISLEQEDLIALIQFLRQELFRGGYTRSLQNQPYPSPAPSITDVSEAAVSAIQQEPALLLDVILTIMSSCMDVIGPLGLLSTDLETQFIQTLIPELSTEIERTMEALDDASQMQGFLRESIRYFESAQKIQRKDASEQDREIATKKFGTISVIFAESGARDEAVNEVTVLPLGLSAEAELSRQKVRKGDGRIMERSKREMGMLKHQSKGPYSLERLVL